MLNPFPSFFCFACLWHFGVFVFLQPSGYVSEAGQVYAIQLRLKFNSPSFCANLFHAGITKLSSFPVFSSFLLATQKSWHSKVSELNGFVQFLHYRWEKKTRPGPGINPPQLAAELDKRGDLQVKSIWNEILTLVFAKTVCSIPFCFKPILHNAVSTGILGFWVVVSPFIQECGRGLVWASSS